MRQLLHDHQKLVVVNGLGGIGKTILAQTYLTRYAADYAYLLWMTQSDGDNFVLDIITAEGLKENLNIVAEGKDQDMLFREILRALHGIEDGPNLWVIDNANTTLHRYFDYLPKPPHWHILASSRERIERFTTKDLDFLSADDALLLFKLHCTRITDEAAIHSVLKTVDYHTLTIEILAKTAQRHDTLLATLQQAIEKDLKAGVYIPHNGDKVERITSYLLSIFEINALSDEEKRLLQHFTALPSEHVPYELLKTLIPADEDGIAPTLQDLADKGWLMYQVEPEAYKMHRIIQEVIKRKLPPTVEGLSGLIKSIGDLLYIDQSKDNPVHKISFIPYGETVLALFPDATDEVISYLQNELGRVLTALGDYAKAKELFEKAVRSAEMKVGKEHPTTAVFYSNLALVFQDIGDYKAAKDLLEKVVRSDEINFGPEHPNTAVSYSNLATVFQALGDYAGAKYLLEKAVRSDEANFGEIHPTTAVSSSNLALVLQALWDYSGAKVLLEKAMYSDEANFGEAHPRTASSYSNLASVLQDLGDYAGAKHLLEKAICSDEANFGKTHPETMKKYSNLATALQALGDYKRAKHLLEKTVHSAEANFGEHHPVTAVSYSNLALLLQDIEDYAGAKQLLEKALCSDEANLGEEHPTTARSQSNLALVLHDLGDSVAAKDLLEKAMHTVEANFGPNHPATVISYSNLAGVLKVLKEYERAVQLAFIAYSIHARHLGETHPNTKKIAGVLNGIANEMLQNGWTEEQIREVMQRG